MVRVAIGMNGHWRIFLRILKKPFFCLAGRNFQSRTIRVANGIKQIVRIILEIFGKLKPKVVWKNLGFKMTGNEVPKVRMNQLLDQIKWVWISLKIRRARVKKGISLCWRDCSIA